MKHCPKCGAQLSDEDDYCYFCGSPYKDLEIGAKDEEEIKFREEKDDNFYYQTEARNGFALAGFILSFFSPIVGFIFSVIGLNKSKDMKGLGRGQAIAGIIISIANFIFSFILYYLAFGASSN